MAIQSINYLSGKIGNIVFYKRSGKYLARSIPASVKQSVATQQRSTNFGIAARAGAVLRVLLEPALPFPKDKNMQRRLQGAIANWLQVQNAAALAPESAVPYLTNFSFNEAGNFHQRFRLPLSVMVTSNELMHLHIPAFVPKQSITAPAHTKNVLCTIVAASTGLNNNTIAGKATFALNIGFNDLPIPEQTISFSLPLARGCLVLTCVILRFQLSDNKTDERAAFLPSGLVDARYC